MKSARSSASLVSVSVSTVGRGIAAEVEAFLRPFGRCLRLLLLGLGALLWIMGVERQSRRMAKLGWTEGANGCIFVWEVCEG
jgi:hypothetical protein